MLIRADNEIPTILVTQAIERLTSRPSPQPSPPAAHPPVSQPNESAVPYDQPSCSVPVDLIPPPQHTRKSSRLIETPEKTKREEPNLLFNPDAPEFIPSHPQQHESPVSPYPVPPILVSSPVDLFKDFFKSANSRSLSKNAALDAKLHSLVNLCLADRPSEGISIINEILEDYFYKPTKPKGASRSEGPMRHDGFRSRKVKRVYRCQQYDRIQRLLKKNPSIAAYAILDMSKKPGPVDISAFKQFWTGIFGRLSPLDIEPLPPVGNQNDVSTLWRPIEVPEIAKLKPSGDQSPGPDGLRIVDCTQFGYEVLAVLFTAIYFFRVTPKPFLKSRTVLLPKSDGATDPADFRPFPNGRGETLAKLSRGVEQGDPLSPVLFNLVVDEAQGAIPHEVGFTINDTLIPAIAYVDDLVIAPSTKVGLQKSVDIIVKVLKKRGLHINGAKSISVGIDANPKSKKTKFITVPFVSVDNTLAKTLRADQKVSYLGVDMAPYGVKNPATLNDINTLLTKIQKAPLTPHQRSLASLDRSVRSPVRAFLDLPHDVLNAYLHARVSDGGLGIQELRLSIPRIRASRSA
ncbi:hypothetical protein QYM36_014997 [Artemia franciscana]|uniref:Reverse transcriptase domain-containing protein n=1 Tax=Artemia franciscana TaxID=6661 RepID=A0AA88HB96_ARTSF|nr:hypothetical protein QYM36_014997 [Artemia franciscana]